MEYKEFRIEKSGCTVIYGGTKEERDIFEKAFLSQNPEYQLQVHPCLRTAKKGLFGKKKTLLDSFLAEVNKSEREALESRLKKQSNTYGISSMLYFTPDHLSYDLKLFWSYLFGIATGRRNFLIRDDIGIFNDVDLCELVSYMQIHAGMSNSHFVWITSKKIPDFLKTIVSDETVATFSNELFRNLIKDATLLDKCHYLYRLQYGNIYQEDKDALHQELKEQARAEREATLRKAAPILAEAKRMEQDGRLTEAFRIYKSYIQTEIPEAIFGAGRLLLEQKLDDPDIKSGMSLILTAADKYLYAPANIYLGDYDMKKLEDSMNGQKHSDYFGDLMNAKSAEKHYALAAKCGSAEGAYKAASLHIRFTSTENYSGDVSHDIRSENAIPYIQQLIKLEKKGDADAGYYLRMLQIKDPEIYQTAKMYF